jgi:hypothetical protein
MSGASAIQLGLAVLLSMSTALRTALPGERVGKVPTVGWAGAFSAESAAPTHSPARPTDDHAAPTSWVVTIGEEWTPPAPDESPREWQTDEPRQRFIEPVEPPPRT